jgi:hypothetical protein
MCELKIGRGEWERQDGKDKMGKNKQKQLT